jgi:hypothetical protein
MNSTITKDTVDGNEIAHHTFTNVEFTAFFNSIFNLEVSSSEPMFLKYYFFIKFGEKVYIEWKYFNNNKAKEIVISFEELQRNTHFKFYYDLSLMLSNNKYLVIQKFKCKEVSPRYKEDRFWKIDTTTINTMCYKNCYDVKNEDLCYIKINPYDLENMEYTPQEQVPKCSYPVNPSSDWEIQIDLTVINYIINFMENELDELSTIFEDKKNVINLVALNGKEGMNSDVLRVIYDFLVISEGHKIYSGIIDKIENCKDKNININTLELNAQILEA